MNLYRVFFLSAACAFAISCVRPSVDDPGVDIPVEQEKPFTVELTSVAGQLNEGQMSLFPAVTLQIESSEDDIASYEASYTIDGGQTYTVSGIYSGRPYRLTEGLGTLKYGQYSLNLSVKSESYPGYSAFAQTTVIVRDPSVFSGDFAASIIDSDGHSIRVPQNLSTMSWWVFVAERLSLSVSLPEVPVVVKEIYGTWGESGKTNLLSFTVADRVMNIPFSVSQDGDFEIVVVFDDLGQDVVKSFPVNIKKTYDPDLYLFTTDIDGKPHNISSETVFQSGRNYRIRVSWASYMCYWPVFDILSSDSSIAYADREGLNEEFDDYVFVLHAVSPGSVTLSPCATLDVTYKESVTVVIE